jgi:hypothetical protein
LIAFVLLLDQPWNPKEQQKGAVLDVNNLRTYIDVIIYTVCAARPARNAIGENGTVLMMLQPTEL